MNGTPHSFSSNKEFTIEILKYLILNMFPNLNQIQVEKFSIEFFNNCEDYKIFKSSVRDLMISSRSFSS
jgi:CRM1 C terminal